MHLIMGQPDDSCCAGVLARLLERGLPARLTPNPLAPPARLEWRLSDTHLQSRFALDGFSWDPISGVLVRDVGWLDPAGWDPADHAYMLAETQAALLAWLGSLPCPVINRPSAAIWYRRRMPLLAWRPLLRRAGLPSAETIVTNDLNDAADFMRTLESDGAGGAILTSLTGDAAWLITSSDTPGLAGLQQVAPVCLTEPHGPVQFACVVGDRIIWNGAVLQETTSLAPNILRLAQMAGLDFVEVSAAPSRRGHVIVLVDPLVTLEHFGVPTRDCILDALVELLTNKTARVRQTEEMT